MRFVSKSSVAAFAKRPASASSFRSTLTIGTTNIYRNARGASSASSSSSDGGTTPLARADQAMAKVRNIGIIAHIDAGKTTASERMLYYAGVSRRMGEVHDGNTVLDYLPQERERGITITAAAISFGWAGHVINLIDTPGHVDFTLEVERSMRVLDGAVALYDAVSGVEAQSETVWAQASRYDVPRIGFANKMDREGASYEGTAAAIEKRLGGKPLLLDFPLGEAGDFVGAVDLVRLRAIAYGDKEGRQPVVTSVTDLLRLKEGSAKTAPFPGKSAGGPDPLSLPLSDLIDGIRQRRTALIESLADVDDAIGDAYLAASDGGDGSIASDIGLSGTVPGLTPDELTAAIRRAVCRQGSRVLPLLCGSAYKNKGVQHLLDSVVAYLPSPLDRQAPVAHHIKTGAAVPVQPSPSAPLRALAFKVQNDRSRGPLVFFRVYSGTLSAKMPLLNASVENELKYSSSGNSGSSDGSTGSGSSGRGAKASDAPSSSSAPGSSSGSGSGAGGHPMSSKERPSKLLQVMGDEHREVEAVAAGEWSGRLSLLVCILTLTMPSEKSNKSYQLRHSSDFRMRMRHASHYCLLAAGHIGAAAGWRHVRTGDTLVLAGDPHPVVLPRLSLPQPVFTAALEVSGQAESKQLVEEALPTLLREDPSLQARRRLL